MPIKARENLIGAWAFLIGVASAAVFGIIATMTKQNINPLILGILAVLGGVVGYFVAEKDIKTFLLASVSLVIVAFAGIQGSIQSAAILGVNINRVITNIMGALLFLFIPSTIVVALKTVFSIAKS